MAVGGRRCAWSGLFLLLVVACASDPQDSAVSPTPPVSVTGAGAQPDPATATTSTTTATPSDGLTVVEVTVREGRVVTDDRLDVPLGDRISMRFDADARLLVHVHGFDEEFSVEAGVLTVFEFEADIPGVFEVEDHLSHRLLVELQVSP